MIDFSFVKFGLLDLEERRKASALLDEFVNYVITHAYYTVEYGNTLLLFESNENGFCQKINLAVIGGSNYNLIISQHGHETQKIISYMNDSSSCIRAYYTDNNHSLSYYPSLPEIKQAIEILQKLIFKKNENKNNS